MVKFRLTCAVWGDWHVDTFLRYGLPSLQAQGNLDAIDYVLAVHTTPKDAARLLPALRHLNREIYTPLYGDIPSGLAHAVDAQQTLHRFDRQKARHTGAIWACVPPDVVWGEGTFARYRELLDAGKAVIFHHMPRVALEPAAPALGYFGRRHLARVALDFEHPLGRMYRADNPSFPPHAELVLWEIEGGAGIVARLLASEVKLLDPSKIGVNHLCQVDRALGDRAGVIADADEAIALSLAPVYKDSDWARDGAPLCAQTVRAFLEQYPSPATRELARHSYRLHAGEVSPHQWAAAERRADALMAEIFDGYQPPLVA